MVVLTRWHHHTLNWQLPVGMFSSRFRAPAGMGLWPEQSEPPEVPMNFGSHLRLGVSWVSSVGLCQLGGR